MSRRYDESQFNPKDQASEYNAAARNKEAKSWLAGQHDTGGNSGLDKATRALQLDANRR